MFSTSNTSSSIADFSGVADDNEPNYVVQSLLTHISGTYSIAANGYGNLTISSANLGDVSVLGVYMTDPHLNLNDPNNTTTGLGGALVADLDTVLSGGTGILVPQTDTATASFKGNYAFAAQAFNDVCCEFDFIGQGSVSGGTLSGTGMLSDPFLTLSGATATNPSVSFLATPLADPGNPGRYTMFSTNSTPNPFHIKINGSTNNFDVVLYQASGGQLFWLDAGASSVFLGSLQKQGSLTGLPAAAGGIAATH
jgi:hypothetical protein